MAYLKIRGNKYYAVWRKNGRKIVQCTEFYVGNAKTRKDALARAQIMESVSTGRTTVEQGVAAVRAAAVASGLGEPMVSIAEFYETHANTHYTGKTRKNFDTAVKHFMKFLGSAALKPADQLEGQKCREFIAAQLKRVRAVTVQGYKVLLAAPYLLAWKEGRIMRNPWATTETPKRDSKERKRFSREEVKYILDNLTYPWKQIVMLDVMTSGQRIGDIVNMQWKQVDLKSRRIRIKTQKTKAPLEIPLSQYGLKMMKELHRISGESEYLFPTMHARYQRSNGTLSVEFIAMLDALGFETHEEEELIGDQRRVAVRCFHSFRHTVVSELQNNPKYTETYAEKLVGQSKAVSKSYHSLLEEEKLDGISFLEATLLKSPKETRPRRKARTGSPSR